MRAPIAVLGPGGVGGFLAAALARAGEQVVVVARESSAETIARDGIAVRSAVLGDFTARLRAVSRLDEDVDVLFVTTKAIALPDALDRVHGRPTLVVPLLNGLDHVARLRERFGARAVAASIRIESDRPAPARIVQSSPAVRVELVSDDPSPRLALQTLAQRLTNAGVPAALGDSEAQVLWSKLARLCALALSTTAADRPLGQLRADPEWRAALQGCVREAAAVAGAAGARIEPAVTMAELDGAHAQLGSSMRRDVASGRAPELDAIAGAVLRAGARHGVACPTIERLAGLVAARAGMPWPAAGGLAQSGT